MCMSSFWSFVFWMFYKEAFNLPVMMLTVCGMNVLIVGIIYKIIPGYDE